MKANVLKERPKKSPNKSAEKKAHYVNAKVFEEQIVRYYTLGTIEDELAESITKIANGLSYAPNFINYSYKDDMVGDAVVKMFSALKNKKFRVGTGFSPFSYFTTIAFHAFINRIKKEKKYQESINQFKEKTYFDLMIDDNVYVEPAHHTGDNDGSELD